MANHLIDGLFSGRDPDRTALISPAGDITTYRALMEAMRRWAGALVTLGVEPGDRVAVQVEKSAEALSLYLATLSVGGVFLPLNTAYTPAEVGYFLGDARPRLFVCDPAAEPALRDHAERAGARLVTLDADGRGALAELARTQGSTFADRPRSAEDLAAIVYTSGTTGRSKGAMLSHGNLLANARTLVEAWRFTSADVLIHALPIYHVHGLFVATHTALASGAAIRFLPRFDPAETMALMARSTVLMGVPTFYTRLLAQPGLTRDAAAGMRLLVSGSAPLLAETHHAFEARTGHRILERYGMTETGMNTSNPYDGERIAGTVGPPLPGVQVRITDEGGEVLGDGEIGMIEVRGPNVFSGYWGMPERTASEFRPGGWFVTGDLGTIDAQGYVSIVGRGKDLIITGGLNVYPKEVEAEIDAMDGVIESAVIGIPHPDFGEAVTAVVAVGRGAAPAEADVLLALGEKIARYKQPKRVIFVEELPRNTMGKVQKAELRRRYSGLYS